MFAIGIGLLIFGAFIGLGGFLGALKNMSTGMTGTVNFEDMAKTHLGAMGVMAFGGVVAFIGMLVGVVALVQ